MTPLQFFVCMVANFCIGGVIGFAVAVRLHARDTQEQISSSHSKMQSFDVLDVCEEKE